MNDDICVYGIVEGPIHYSEYPEYDGSDTWVVVAQIEGLNKAIIIEEVYFNTFDDALEVVDYFKKPHNGPFILTQETWEGEDF